MRKSSQSTFRDFLDLFGLEKELINLPWLFTQNIFVHCILHLYLLTCKCRNKCTLYTVKCTLYVYPVSLALIFITIKIVLRNTTLEWEPICLIYLRLSSRHCKSLFPCHQPWQQLVPSKCLTYCICDTGRPDCNVMEKAPCNSHSLAPL